MSIELLIVITMVILVLGLVGFVVIGLLSSFMGAPFVPASQKTLAQALKEAKLKPGQRFYDLGSGDGRIVRFACTKYRVSGVGIEANPVLILYSYVLSLVQGIDGTKFKWANIFNVDLSDADVVYIFLLPQALIKLEPKLKKECKKGTLIISHGFSIKGLEYLLERQINSNKLFPTRYYRIR